ncbi:hexosaminidase D [Aricia agestis]|uniref:hexosaminidase D n=1 Tax=Aricia agestis TaxID=91739 RepID=UPI001C203D1D|nr:hexosaminidase D [Aricia agestis]
MHRIVHLDFKGAPLKVQYLDQVLESIRQWGATGVLLEWEDTFPYSGELSIIGSIENCNGDHMYTMDEVQQILQAIKSKGLEPIQLVQTIGHMEFVLKHPAFRELREEPRSPAVLCPTKPKSLHLVKAMIQNALDAQPDAKYFHIGADEVWHTAICEDCQRKASVSEHKATSLFLDHIKDLLIFLKMQRPKMNVLMWDDMLRAIGFEVLEKSNIGKLVEPVVWNYNVAEHFFVGGELWRNYRIFPKVWAASAFKGANGSCQMLSPVSRYMSNQQAWIREVQANADRANFTGVILTGWSRFDHYATLCELLPVSLPALYSCLSIWIHPNDSISSLTHEVLPENQWAGLAVARAVHSLVALRDRANQLLHGDAVSTWLNPWQVERGYTCPVQVDGIAGTANEILLNLQCLERELSAQLSYITGPRSADEWIGSNITPLVSKVSALHRQAARTATEQPSVRPVL